MHGTHVTAHSNSIAIAQRNSKAVGHCAAHRVRLRGIQCAGLIFDVAFIGAVVWRCVGRGCRWRRTRLYGPGRPVATRGGWCRPWAAPGSAASLGKPVFLHHVGPGPLAGLPGAQAIGSSPPQRGRGLRATRAPRAPRAGRVDFTASTPNTHTRTRIRMSEQSCRSSINQYGHYEMQPAPAPSSARSLPNRRGQNPQCDLTRPRRRNGRAEAMVGRRPSWQVAGCTRASTVERAGALC